MPHYLTSSRITKARPGIARHSSSPLSALRRTKTASSSPTLIKTLSDGANESGWEREWLATRGELVPTFNVAEVADVVSAIHYTTQTMFSALPERAGMNSTRIAEVLNFQKNLPPVVSLPHVHAIISASSKTEREIQDLLMDGKLLKLRVTGRGNNVNGLAEIVILVDDYRQLLDEKGLSIDIVSALFDIIARNPRASSVSTEDLSSSAATALLQSGFLVSASLLGSRNLSLSGASVTGVPTISRAASGTSAAVGGEAAFEQLGGVGVGQRSQARSDSMQRASELALSVPNIGTYLRILESGRHHLVDLLRVFKHKQAPLYLLRERWDGAVDSNSSVSQAKQIRGEFSRILPAKTRKWRDLKGLNFDWVIEECLGAGMIELFETHSVGLGVRSLV